MKQVYLLILVLAISGSVAAQKKDTKELQTTARNFVMQGDYANGIVVLNQALQQDPTNLETLKDLVFAYYLQKNYSKALEIAKPLPDRNDADVQCYQELGLVYKALEERKECEKMYKQGIKRFPESGVLYNEYGEMLWSKQDYDAIKQWEKGIEADPNYSPNYYNASKHYYFTYDKVWSIIYGEIFVNLESYSKRTDEIKDLLIESYKKLFSDANLEKSQNTKNPFVAEYLKEIGKQSMSLSNGISAEALTDLRTKFLNSWFENSAGKFPFRLFDYQKQLIGEGMFEAYNQWLFNTDKNSGAYAKWTSSHTDQFNKFSGFQKGRIFKMPENQYYHGVTK